MKNQFNGPLLAALLFVVIAPELFAQSTNFTYQGRLDDGGMPAEGVYDILYGIYDGPTPSNGTYLSGGEIEDLVISNGLFTVDLLAEHWVFDGASRWLGVEVRTNGPGTHTKLEPWTEITPTPYAVRALTVAGDAFAGGHSGIVSFSNSSNTFAGTFNGVFTGDGGALTNVEATTLDGLTSDGFWQLGGNAGTAAGTDFLGTTDDEPLEFRVNNQRGLRMEYVAKVVGVVPTESVNILCGYSENYIGSGTVGAVISGGGGTSEISFASNGIGSDSDYSTISGGTDNRIDSNSLEATIGGGLGNTIATNVNRGVIAGGLRNKIVAGANMSAIGGGSFNEIGRNTKWATIPGGWSNEIREDALYSTIAGGQGNQIGSRAENSAVGGGKLNEISADSANCTIAGGLSNEIRGVTSYGTISGGWNNRVSTNAWFATIPGGRENWIGPGAWYALAAGYRAKANHVGAFVWADSTTADFASTADDQFLIRASGGVGIGTTSPDAPLHIDGGTDTAVGGGGFAVLGDLTAGNISIDDNEIMARKNGATSSLYLNVNGGTVAIGTSSADMTYTLRVNGSVAGVGNYNNISDARYKTDIREVEGALDKVMHMRGVHYDWKTEEFPDLRFDEGRQLGFVAQELAEVVPEVVSEDAAGSLSVAYSKLVPVLVEAMKEQQRQIDRLEQMLGATLKDGVQ